MGPWGAKTQLLAKSRQRWGVQNLQIIIAINFFREQSPKEFNSSWDSVGQVFYDAYEQKYIISIKIIAHISEKEFSML